MVVSRSTLESLLGAPLKRVREESHSTAGWETGWTRRAARKRKRKRNGHRETPNRATDTEIPAGEPADPPRTEEVVEIVDPGERAARMSAPAPRSQPPSRRSMQRSRGLSGCLEATGMLGEALRLTRTRSSSSKARSQPPRRLASATAR